VPDSPQISKDERLQRFKRRLYDGSNLLRRTHQDYIGDHAYYGGDQWAEMDVQKLIDEDRSPIVVNLLRKTIDAVSGQEITNRFEPKLLPRTPDDQGLADKLSETIRFLRQAGQAPYQETIFFRDACIAGIGAVEYIHDFTLGMNGRTRVEWVPVQELLWDPTARGPNLIDRKWDLRGTWMSEDEWKSMFPDSDVNWEDIVQQTVESETYPMWPHPEVTEPHDASRAHLYEQDARFYNPRSKEILVYDEQCFEPYYNYIVLNTDTGEEREMSGEEYRELHKTLLDAGKLMYPSTRVQRRTFFRTFWVGETELEHIEMPHECFTREYITGFREVSHETVKCFGLVKAGRNAQDVTNKAISQLIYTVSTNPKGAILAKKRVFDDFDEAMGSWARPNSIIEISEDAELGVDYEIVHGQYPDSFERIYDIATQMVPTVTGVPPYFSGDIQDLRRTAGSAVSQVQAATDRVLSVLFDSLGLYRERSGRIYLEYMKAYMPNDEIIRITDEEGQLAAVPFDRSWVEDWEYDVVLSEAPRSANAQREFWASLMQTDAFSQLVEQGLLTPDIVAEIMPDIPDHIREKMKANAARMQQAAQMEAGGEMPQQLPAGPMPVG
jgi:hypothetical protein